jgi:hypothetical protein
VQNACCQDVQLTDFEVDLNELERHVGLRFHSQLDRGSTGKLCLIQGCRYRYLSLISFLTANENSRYRAQLHIRRDQALILFFLNGVLTNKINGTSNFSSSFIKPHAVRHHQQYMG